MVGAAPESVAQCPSLASGCFWGDDAMLVHRVGIAAGPLWLCDVHGLQVLVLGWYVEQRRGCVSLIVLQLHAVKSFARSKRRLGADSTPRLS
jgi:hypothetical protein